MRLIRRYGVLCKASSAFKLPFNEIPILEILLVNRMAIFRIDR